MAAPVPSSRWLADPSVPRGADYDARFEALAAQGDHVHGEADLVTELTPGPDVLDAGCGTGRVAIELARRGHRVVGTDIDPAKLELAKAYLEIGDKDGAREILQEVLKEGSAGQKDEAERLIASL